MSPANEENDYLIKTLQLIGRLPIFVIIRLLELSLRLKYTTFPTRLISPKLLRKKTHTVQSVSFFRPKTFLPRLNLSTLIKFSVYTCMTLIIATLISGITFYFQIINPLPNPATVFAQKPPATSQIYDRNGILLYQLYQDQNRTPTQLSNLPIYLVQAHLAIEDSDFFKHHGISFPDISRALIHNIKLAYCQTQNITCTGSLQGASTITQQLIKNTILTPERTLKRKLQEIYLSLSIEQNYTKEQILERYLNTISYGGTAYGIEAASYQYFDKSAKDLTLPEAALLAGLPAAPSAYSPFGSNPEQAFERQKMVLTRMLELNYINFNQYNEALAQQLTFAPPQTDIRAPHFVMYTRSQLESKLPTSILYQGGLQITSSLDYQIQSKAEQILQSEIDKLRQLNVTNGAILVTKPKTGEILAMVGSVNYFDSVHQGNVNATIALRQPGSSIKPLTYATALSQSASNQNSTFTAASYIADAPVSFRIAGSPDYKPRNYDGKFHGMVSLRTALASSYNIPAVKILDAIGVNKLLDFGEKLGITTWTQPERYGLSITLGGAEVRMTDLAVVYGTFANMGYKQPLKEILAIKGIDLENSNLQSPFTPTPVLDPSVAYIINDILSDPNARAPTFGRISKLSIPNHKVAVKTGTSNDLRDNWTIGYTQDYLVAVWVGNFDNSPMSRIASGITGATPIWNQIMTYLLTEYDPNPNVAWQQPDNIIRSSVCTPKPENCPNCQSRSEIYVKGTQPNCAFTAIKEAAKKPQQLSQIVPNPTPIEIKKKLKNEIENLKRKVARQGRFISQ